MTKPKHLGALLLLALAACAHPQGGPVAAPRPDALLAAASAFMQSYAADLLAGEREKLIARYDARGAYFVGNGYKRLESLDSIAARYRNQWQPPASFAWEDLSYEVAGPDAVVVTGTFTWGPASGQPVHLSYTALLLRTPQGLRIRLEDESR